MSLPLPPNTTCDIYRNSGSLSAAGVACNLVGVYEEGLERGEHGAAANKYSHIMLVDVSVDIRDGYSYGTITAGNQDKVYVPDQASGTLFKVIFVERHNQGQTTDHKRVFLQRQSVSWPSNEL